MKWRNRAEQNWPHLVAFLAFVAFVPTLGHWFFSDDFALIDAFGGLGFGGVLRFLLLADPGTEWVYWRPGAAGLFALCKACFGMWAMGYHLVAVILHCGTSVLVGWLVRKWGGGPAGALCGGAFFACISSHGEAVAWIAAAFNVVPAAALIVLAVGQLYRWRSSGNTRALWTGVAALLASLCFKEAAYGVLPVAMFLVGSGHRGSRVSPLTANAALVLGVLLHGLFLSPRMTGGELRADRIWATIAHGSEFLASLSPFENWGWPAGVAIALALSVCAVRHFGRAAWVTIAWMAFSPFPYVMMTHGGRFLYFFHLPFALLVGLTVTPLFRARRGNLLFQLLYWGILVGMIAVNWRWLSLFELAGVKCAAVRDLVCRDADAVPSRVIVDGVPAELENGLASMIHLHSNARPKILSLQVFPKPPFMIYFCPELSVLSPTEQVFRITDSTRLGVSTLQEVFAGFVPLPVLAIVGKYALAKDSDGVLAEVANRRMDLRACPVLTNAPDCELDPTVMGTMENIVLNEAGVRLDVTLSANGLLVVAFPVPVDWITAGAIYVDGHRAKVMTANGEFVCFCVQAGRHHVDLSLR